MNAFILTGGGSRRFGKDKATLTINGITFVEVLYKTLSSGFDAVTVVGKKCLHPQIPFIKDHYSVQTPINGILTSLQYSDSDWNFFISVDMPAISLPLVSLLQDNIRDDTGVVIPVSDGRRYPTCAFYHKDSSDVFEVALQQEKYKLLQVIKKVRPVYVNADIFRQNFINVNTPVEYELLKKVMASGE